MTAVASSIPPQWYLLLAAGVFCIGLFECSRGETRCTS